MAILELRIEDWQSNPKSTPYSLLPILTGEFGATISRLQLDRRHHRVDTTYSAATSQRLSIRTKK
jgi:hypothetical protein